MSDREFLYDGGCIDERCNAPEQAVIAADRLNGSLQFDKYNEPRAHKKRHCLKCGAEWAEFIPSDNETGAE